MDRKTARLAFALALRRRRVRKGLSQEQVAHEGVARSHISDLERGLTDPKLTTILELARILGVRPSKLVADVERQYARLMKSRQPPPSA